MDILFARKRVGERAASRVRVEAPQGSAYNGRRGIVINTFPEYRTAIVQLRPGLVLPFGYDELREVR